VLVVDDHAVVREGIRGVLAATPGFDVVGEAGDGAEALELAEEQRPDVVVLDLTMPGMSGLEATAALRRQSTNVRVLILSMHDHPEYVLQAVRAGAHGYVLKDATPDELRTAVRTVYQGSDYFAPAAAQQLGAAVRGEMEGEERRLLAERLTPRERDVLIRVAEGLTNKEIASQLGISPRTVETHRDGIARKLRMRSVAELTRFVMETGLSEDG
jgi:two-component system response regulator NreC